MTTRNRFLKMCDKKSSPPNTYQAVLFSPTNRDKTVVWALLGKVGHVLHRFLRATRAKHGASGFFTAHCFNHHPDSQRETPDKRIALAEVHKLCVVVFDFLEYSVLLFRQRSG